MTSEKNSTLETSFTSYFFIFLLIAGIALLIFSLYTAEQGRYFGGLQQIAAGMTLIGIGEWINHPLQKSIAYKDRKNFIFKQVYHRKRKPNGVGNICEIIGLILIFTGMAEYI
tara:strand:+ start:96 stop:434 length:339 start_codon:yes stop_codon:yes gene_type:complete